MLNKKVTQTIVLDLTLRNPARHFVNQRIDLPCLFIEEARDTALGIER